MNNFKDLQGDPFTIVKVEKEEPPDEANLQMQDVFWNIEKPIDTALATIKHEKPFPKEEFADGSTTETISEKPAINNYGFDCKINIKQECEEDYSLLTVKQEELDLEEDNYFEETILEPSCSSSLRQENDHHETPKSGVKSYLCDSCDYKTTRKFDLSVHETSHTGEKPFSCDSCDYKCYRKIRLTEHQWTHISGKRLSCTFCDYTSTYKRDLVEHYRIHSGEKPFSCSFCKSKFSRKSNLSMHEKVHSGKKPFKCSLCDYSCIRKFDLGIHQKTHVGEKSFRCGYCDYQCSRKCNFDRHLKIHARKKPLLNKQELKMEKLCEENEDQ